MSTADRMKAMRERRRKAGHVRREYYATPDEHERIKQLLEEARGDAPHNKQ